MYLKLYERNKLPLSFDDSKPIIQKVFSTSRDETIVISECTNIDNQSRRKDMLKLILSLDSQAQPHNTAIISTAAQKENLHLFTTGLPGYGKAHHLTERMCSLQKQGIRTVVFDVSGSFTKDEIIEKLSVGGDDKILNEVENYVNEHITFHNIETEGIPVEPLMLHFSDDITEKKNILFSIIMSHFGSFGKVQEVFIAQLITNLITTNNLSIIECLQPYC